ncbi:MAG TPA: hypothetical protein PK847_00355 [Candidatus Sumerlaeota bacterium]|nr:hypothetical protein [Candidatus Sumerlaeota bacterium]
MRWIISPAASPPLELLAEDRLEEVVAVVGRSRATPDALPASRQSGSSSRRSSR